MPGSAAPVASTVPGPSPALPAAPATTLLSVTMGVGGQDRPRMEPLLLFHVPPPSRPE